MEKWRDRRMLNNLTALMDSHKNEVVKLEKCMEYFQVMGNDERKAFIKGFNRGKAQKILSFIYLGVMASIGSAVVCEKATGWFLDKIDKYRTLKEEKEKNEEETEVE